MFYKIRTLKHWVFNFRNYPKELNRRANVEQQLWDVYHGRAPTPDVEQFKVWALALGVPQWWRVK